MVIHVRKFDVRVVNTYNADFKNIFAWAFKDNKLSHDHKVHCDW